MKIILASGSPRRKELLEQIGLEFEIIKSDVEEVVEPGTSIDRVPCVLSKQKALDVLDRLEGEVVVIGADTIVAIGDKILGKPKNQEEAIEMLATLSGNSHEVYTGVTLAYYEGNKAVTEEFVCKTVVNVAPMTMDEIMEYISTKDCYDKAGGYGIQGAFAKFINSIDGDYYNVVGLPVCQVYKNIKKILKK